MGGIGRCGGKWRKDQLVSSSQRLAHVELHIAVLLFGLSGLFAKLIAAGPITIVVGRCVFAALVLLIGLKLFSVSLSIHSKRTGHLLIVSGVILAVHWLTFFHAIQLSTVAIGLVGFATFPIFVTFIEPLVGRSSIRPVDVGCAVAVLIGLLLVVPDFSLDDTGTVGLLWAVFSAALFAVLALMNRNLLQRQTFSVVAFYQQATAALCLLPFLWIEGLPTETETIGLLLLLGAICTALPHTLFIKALGTLKAQLVSIVTGLEPVYGIIFAAWLLHEIPGFSVIVGALIVFSAVVVATVSHKQSETNHEH